MSKRILSKDLFSEVEKQVYIQGWLHKKREVSSKLAFLVIRDRQGLVQVVVENEQEIAKLKGLQNGTILGIQGKVVAEPRAMNGVEIHEPILEILVPVAEVLPIEIDKPINHESENFDTLFEYRVLSLRNVTERGIFKVQEAVLDSLRKYLKSQDFTEFNSPKLLAGATEGGAEVFTLDYFGKTASLAQSAQFYKQIMVGVFERVFEINPTYRAELSFTPRHMTEFMHIDMEIGFVDSHEELLAMTESLINFVVHRVWEKREPELLALKATKPLLINKFPRITLKDLHELYLKETGKDFRHEPDPSPEQERWICEYSAEKWNSEAVYVTDFPTSSMKFYHKINEQNPEVCYRADLLFRGVEIATVPLRENRYDKLIEQMLAAGLDPENPGNKYYLMAFKYGLPPHGGFGMGLERLTQKIIGLGSVKEASLFPRDVQRLTP